MSYERYWEYVCDRHGWDFECGPSYYASELSEEEERILYELWLETEEGRIYG